MQKNLGGGNLHTRLNVFGVIIKVYGDFNTVTAVSQQALMTSLCPSVSLMSVQPLRQRSSRSVESANCDSTEVKKLLCRQKSKKLLTQASDICCHDLRIHNLI